MRSRRVGPTKATACHWLALFVILSFATAVPAADETTRVEASPSAAIVNASAERRGSDIVVTYDLDAKAPVGVWLVASRYGGCAFSVPVLDVFSDLGPEVDPGPRKRVVWHLLSDYTDPAPGDDLVVDLVIDRELSLAAQRLSEAEDDAYQFEKDVARVEEAKRQQRRAIQASHKAAGRVDSRYSRKIEKLEVEGKNAFKEEWETEWNNTIAATHPERATYRPLPKWEERESNKTKAEQSRLEAEGRKEAYSGGKRLAPSQADRAGALGRPPLGRTLGLDHENELD